MSNQSNLRKKISCRMENQANMRKTQGNMRMKISSRKWNTPNMPKMSFMTGPKLSMPM